MTKRKEDSWAKLDCNWRRDPMALARSAAAIYFYTFGPYCTATDKRVMVLDNQYSPRYFAQEVRLHEFFDSSGSRISEDDLMKELISPMNGTEPLLGLMDDGRIIVPRIDRKNPRLEFKVKWPAESDPALVDDCDYGIPTAPETEKPEIVLDLRKDCESILQYYNERTGTPHAADPQSAVECIAAILKDEGVSAEALMEIVDKYCEASEGIDEQYKPNAKRFFADDGGWKKARAGSNGSGAPKRVSKGEEQAKKRIDDIQAKRLEAIENGSGADTPEGWLEDEQ